MGWCTRGKKGLTRLALDVIKNKVQLTLRIEIDDEVFENVYGHKSRPIPGKKRPEIGRQSHFSIR